MRPPSSPRCRLWLALALYAGMAAILLAGTFRNFEKLGGKDWNAFLGAEEAEVASIVHYGEFPTWNPWRRGGQAGFAQPESMFLSPVTPLAFLVGSNAAFKLWLLPCFVLAGLGMFALAGELGLAGAARYVPGAVFIGSAILPLYVNGGLPNWLFGMTTLPWLLLASRRATEQARWIVIGAALFAALLCCGSVHHFVFFPLLLALDAAVRALARRSLAPLLSTAAIGVTGIALSAVRLVPLLALFSEIPRTLDASGRYMPLSLIGPSLLLPPPPAFDHTYGMAIADGSDLYWVDCGAFVGPIVLLLAAVAVMRSPKRVATPLLITLAFLWMALGTSVPLSLWGALHHVPVFASMQAPQRFMGYGVFGIALLAGHGFAFADERLRARVARWRSAPLLVSLALVALVVVPLLVIDAPICNEAFTAPAPEGHPPTTVASRGQQRPPFRQRHFKSCKQQWGGVLYEPVLVNAGNPDGQTDVPTPLVAIAAEDPGYRGETFLDGDHGKITRSDFTANTIRVDAELDEADTLIVNQAWFPGWRVRGTVEGDCYPDAARIAVKLPAGRHQLQLEYAPRTLPIGAALTAIAVVVIAGWAWRRRRNRARAPALGGGVDRAGCIGRADLVALGLEGVLALGIIGWHATQAPRRRSPPPPLWPAVALEVSPEAKSGDHARFPTVQQAIDATKPGDVVRVTRGTYGAARVAHGVTLVADPIDGATLTRLEIVNLPAGELVAILGFTFASPAVGEPPPEIRVEQSAGTIVLEHLRAAAGGAAPRLVVDQSTNLHLFDVDLAALESTQGQLSLARCHVAGGVVANGGVLLLNHTTLSDTTRPALTLRDGAVARCSMVTDAMDVPSQEVDATSSLTFLDATDPDLTIDHALNVDGSANVTITGPPNASGTLLVSSHPALIVPRNRKKGQFIEVDSQSEYLRFPFNLSSHGELRYFVPPMSERYRPGFGLFVQAYFTSDDDPSLRTGLMDGGLAEPR